MEFDNIYHSWHVYHGRLDRIDDGLRWFEIVIAIEIEVDIEVDIALVPAPSTNSKFNR